MKCAEKKEWGGHEMCWVRTVVLNQGYMYPLWYWWNGRGQRYLEELTFLNSFNSSCGCFLLYSYRLQLQSNHNSLSQINCNADHLNTVYCLLFYSKDVSLIGRGCSWNVQRMVGVHSSTRLRTTKLEMKGWGKNGGVSWVSPESGWIGRLRFAPTDCNMH